MGCGGSELAEGGNFALELLCDLDGLVEIVACEGFGEFFVAVE